MRVTSLVVFDFFGTVVSGSEPMPATSVVVEAVCTRTNANPERMQGVVHRFFDELLENVSDDAVPQEPTVSAISTALSEIGVRMSSEEIDDLLWELLGPGATPYSAMPGAIDLIEELALAGVAMRVLSNSVMPSRLLRRIATSVGLGGLHHIRASGDGGPKKPQAAAFDCIGAGAFKRRLMVGDLPHYDLTTPRALGWEVVHAIDQPSCWKRVRDWVSAEAVSRAE